MIIITSSDLFELFQDKFLSKKKQGKLLERSFNYVIHKQSVKFLSLLFIQNVIDKNLYKCQCSKLCEFKFEDNLVFYIKKLLWEKIKKKFNITKKKKLIIKYKIVYVEEAKKEIKKIINLKYL